MKAYVITIEDREPSVKAAEKCIESAAKFGIKVEKWPAITPRNTDISVPINGSLRSIPGSTQCNHITQSRISYILNNCKIFGDNLT